MADDTKQQRLDRLVKAVGEWECKTSNPKFFGDMADVAIALGEASAFLVVALDMLGVKDNG